MTTGGPEVNAHWRSLSMQFNSFTMSVVTNILTTVPSKKEKLPLSVTHPELAKEADGWDPSVVTFGSDVKRSWKCSLGHTWTISPNGRTAKGGTNCPVCANQKLLIGYNDLSATHPELAAQAFGWDPKSVVSGTNQKVTWKCARGHIWDATVASRSGQGVGCPFCSNKKVLAGFNDLSTTNRQLASEAYGWDPTEYTEGSGKRKEWICNLGHVWSAQIGMRSKQMEGCPYCSNQKVLIGFNDLATTHPQLALEANGWDPTLYIAGSLKKMSWVCPIGHEYSSSIRDRARRFTNCTICVGKVVLPGFNDLQTDNPTLASEAHGWDPKTTTSGSQKVVQWKCSIGHIWKAKVANRAILFRGCPTCAKTGFDPNKDGFLYFISHPDWEMLQIGITNVPDKRLKEHKSLGWQLLEVRGPMDGHLTQQWETAILRMLKAKGADLSNARIAGRFDGYSEAWSKTSFEVKSIKELMDLTEEFEDN